LNLDNFSAFFLRLQRILRHSFHSAFGGKKNKIEVLSSGLRPDAFLLKRQKKIFLKLMRSWKN